MTEGEYEDDDYHGDNLAIGYEHLSWSLQIANIVRNQWSTFLTLLLVSITVSVWLEYHHYFVMQAFIGSTNTPIRLIMRIAEGIEYTMVFFMDKIFL